MDICISNALPATDTEKLSWMSDITFNLSSFQCCRDLRLRKRHKEIDECNLFSRIEKWVVDPIDDINCSISLHTSPSSQVQLSPKDSGVDINSPSRKEDGTTGNMVMPDSRSEDCERPWSKVKRRRLLRDDSKDRLDLKKSAKTSNEKVKCPVSKGLAELPKLESVPETAMKKYTLVSNTTEDGPLVIKLRACPLEPPASLKGLKKGEEIQAIHVESPDISSTVQQTFTSSDATLCDQKSSQRHRNPSSSVPCMKNTAAVVSSTTRHKIRDLQKKKKKKKDTFREFRRFTPSSQSEFQNKIVDSAISLDCKISQNLIDMGNNLSKTITGCLENDDTKLCDHTSMPSAEKATSINKRRTKCQSKKVISACEAISEGNNYHSPHLDNSVSVVSSSSSTEKKLLSEKANSEMCDNDSFSEAKKNTRLQNELTNFIKSSDQPVNASLQLRHLPANYQVTRRHARIFRRSTLLPQLHRSGAQRDFRGVQNLERIHEVSVKKEPEEVSTVENNENLKASFSVGVNDAEFSIDQIENEVLLDEILFNLSSTDFLCENQGNSDFIPDLLCNSLLEEDHKESQTILDEILLQVPVTSSLTENPEESEATPKEILSDLPSTSLPFEDSFISDQKQLIKLRNGVFCLLRTLVPQLHMPDRFDAGGHAVDELVDVVCEELDDSRRLLSKNSLPSLAFQSPCMNSSVDLCRSPRDCLSRLRCKVLTLLRLLLGIDLDQSDEENLLESLLDIIVVANCMDDNNDIELLSAARTECFSASDSVSGAGFVPLHGEAVEEISSLDSFSDIPELLVESERKIVMGDTEDFLEPPKLTAVEER